MRTAFNMHHAKRFFFANHAKRYITKLYFVIDQTLHIQHRKYYFHVTLSKLGEFDL